MRSLNLTGLSYIVQPGGTEIRMELSLIRKKLIEVALPLDAINTVSVREGKD